MKKSATFGPLQVDKALYEFVAHETLPGTGIDEQTFWTGFCALVQRLIPKNTALLEQRDHLQYLIDEWHCQHPGPAFDAIAYKEFLLDIGYLIAEKAPFSVATSNVDDEIACIAGPQLVVPVSNARYALNAANARWGSLYDAVYGTDVISTEGGATIDVKYNSVRGKRVIEFARDFLDSSFPLTTGSHRDVIEYGVSVNGLTIKLRSGGTVLLSAPETFIGFQGEATSPGVILLKHHGLHVELHIDRQHHIGQKDLAGISDIMLESAITTIQDCEDSVAAVSTEEKIAVYRNWLGLMKGTLEARLEKAGKVVVRRLNSNRRYQTSTGAEVVLPGRSLMLVRNVSNHMLSHAVTLDGEAIPETFIDAAVTTLAALHDLRAADGYRNSRTGSIYIVKPKMHGPEEVAFADELFAGIEDLLNLPRYTLKIGIMDEERRTSVNLAECIRAVKQRIVFINTGFLDRTGDEIHTSMQAGPVPFKNELRKALWLAAYERQNVDVGLACGLKGHAQIGKGMWAMPDLMADMLRQKIAHPLAGASTAWIPSPTAATLHALHYHQVDVASVQCTAMTRRRASLDDILKPPLVTAPVWTAVQIEEELNSNAQSILGYVVRWIDSGVGCSKVLDYYNVALMEDRATLRISSQHVANWLHHEICTRDQVMMALQRMAKIVDQQNAADPTYHAMSNDLENSIAFKTACDLVFKGRVQPNGYTESILIARRREKIQSLASD